MPKKQRGGKKGGHAKDSKGKKRAGGGGGKGGDSGGSAPRKAKGKGGSSAAAAGGGGGGRQLIRQLDEIGLYIRSVGADGNCLFRAVADQVCDQGEEDHADLRQRAVAYMKENPDDFAPFVEDDEGFDKYLDRMETEGTWGGNMELQALSMALKRNIVLHQAGHPCWKMVNFPDSSMPLINVAYIDGEHYESVRYCDDDDYVAPPITEADDLVDKVIEKSRPTDWSRKQVEDALAECGGEVDATIQYLKATSRDEDVKETANGTLDQGQVQNRGLDDPENSDSVQEHPGAQENHADSSFPEVTELSEIFQESLAMEPQTNSESTDAGADVGDKSTEPSKKKKKDPAKKRLNNKERKALKKLEKKNASELNKSAKIVLSRGEEVLI